MIRYRESWGGGVTKKSLVAFKKHCHRLGKILSIKGYVYQGKCGKTPAVLITGENGTMRLGGFSWGYDGEGPRGLIEVLKELKIDQCGIDRIMKLDFDWKVTGEVWKINF